LDFTNVARQLLISALPILIAITFHEVSHGLVANKLGDPTAKMLGRLTLNPIAHIDLFGTILLPFMLIVLTHGQFVFGYAKPVPINPMNFRNPKRDMAISAAAGPVTNIVLAFLSFLVLKGVLTPLAAFVPGSFVETVLKPLAMMFTSSIVINVVLAVFNMIPIPPLDGGRVLTGFLPHRQAISFSRIEPYGFIIVIVLIYTGIANSFIMPFIRFFLRLFQVYY
jgi:Zn-dependent protease